MAAHRYWRVYVTAGNNGLYLDIAEIEFHSTIGGADQCTGGTAIESNHSDTGHEAAKAFDNDNATNWLIYQPSFHLPQWVGYDFGAGNSKDIVEFSLTCVAAGTAPRDFQLQYSDDGTTWTTTIFRYAEGWSGTNQVKTFSSNNGPAASANKAFWRIRTTAVDGSSVVGLSELRMMSTSGGTNLCTGGTAWASSAVYGAAASNAFNGIAETSTNSDFWAGDTDTEWIGYQFSSPVDIMQIQIAARVGTPNQSPKNFLVEYWDGSQYAVAWTVTGSSGWGSGEVRTFTKTIATPSRVPSQVFVCC